MASRGLIMNDRRREIRIAEENCVIIEMERAAGDEGLEAFGAFTRDISVGGVRVQSDKPFSKGDEYTLIITLSKSRQIIKIHGNVRWVREIEPGLFEAGFQFLHEIPGSILTLINHLFRKTAGVSTLVHR
jgi:hypothetical protein